jgi:hypothetical protein
MQSICDQVGRQSDAIYRKGRTPTVVMFSQEGYRNALYQDCHGTCFGTPTNPPTKLKYMGMPYSINREQVEPVKVLDEQQVEGGIRLEVSDPFANTEKRTETVVLIGRALTHVQLSNIIAAYTEANPSGDFSAALAAVVRAYGRFE